MLVLFMFCMIGNYSLKKSFSQIIEAAQKKKWGLVIRFKHELRNG